MRMRPPECCACTPIARECFTGEEIELLQELARDISHALESLQQEEHAIKPRKPVIQTELIYQQAIKGIGGVPYQRSF